MHASHWEVAAPASQDYSYQTFVPELSVGDLHEPIVTLNLPLIGVIETLHATVSGLALQTLLDLLVSIIARYAPGIVVTRAD